jgi:hypothetical protein
MSQLNIDIIENRSGGPVALTQQAASKAHINFNMTGTPAIRDDLNFSSLTDGASGNCTANYTNNMGNVNYTYVTSGEYDGGVHAGMLLWNHDANTALTTANFPVLGFKTHDTGVADLKFATIVIFGDLA